MIIFLQFILFAFGTPTQPVNWPTDIFKQKYYSYHGLATGITLFIISLAPHSAQLTVKLGRISFYLDEKARTLRYFKESYESSHHRRVIENKLDGKSYRAWFEDPNLVHFIQKDYLSCSTKEGFQFLYDVRFLESYRGSL